MKTDYKLARGKTVEVEVTAEQAVVIAKIVKKSENNDYKHLVRKTRETSLEYLSDEHDWEPQDGTTDVQREVEREDDAERMKRAIDCLTEKQQTIIRLHFYDGYQFVEIAEIMGISKSTVSRHFDAAKKALEKILKNF